LPRLPVVPALAPVGRVPVGRIVELPGRGTTYVVDSGPEDAPAYVLLHSVCTGLMTWYPALDVVRGFGRVVVFDQRCHGQGISTPRSCSKTAPTMSFYQLQWRARQRRRHPGLADRFNPPPTFLNHKLAPGRTFASATLSLVDVKTTSKRLAVTINDLVLAIAAGGLRRLLLDYVGPLAAGSAMNVTVWSCVDQLNISVLSDDQTFEDMHYATDAFIGAFAEIRAGT
jgi:hypothetical protein